MNFNQKINKSEELLIKGKLEDCLKILIETTRHIDKDFYKKSIYLASQFNRYKTEDNMGLIDSNVQKNKVIASVIDLIFEIRNKVDYYQVLKEKEIINYPAIPFSEKFNVTNVFLRGKRNGIFGWVTNTFRPMIYSHLGFTRHPTRKEMHLILRFLFFNYSSTPVLVMNFRESKLIFKDKTHLSSIVGDQMVGERESKSWIPKIIEINNKSPNRNNHKFEIPPLGFIVIEHRYRIKGSAYNFKMSKELESIEMNLTNFKEETIFFNDFIRY